MSLNELFVVNTTTRLTSDMNSWGDQIISQLLNKFPTLSKVVGEVVFSKVDNIKSNALGYITLIGKQQRIPFIVDECELNPLDIYIDNGNYLPLTESAINRIESRSWPFRLISQTERGSILKTASLFEDTGIIKQEFIDKHKDVLVKVASEYPEVIETFSTRNIETQNEEFVVRCFIKEASDIKPIVLRSLVNPDEEYKISEFTQKFGKDFVQELMTKGEAIVSNMTPKVQCEIDKLEIKGAYKPSQKRDGYTFIEGEPVKAHLYDHYKISDLKRSTMSPNVIVTETGIINQYMTSLYAKEGNASSGIILVAPQVGDYALFIIGDNAYGPVFINSISKIGNDKVYNITDNELKQINIRTSEDIKTIIQLDKSNYLFSQFGKVIKVKSMREFTWQKPKDIIKEAALTVNVVKQLDGKLNIQDAGLSGVEAPKLKNMSKSDAIVALMRSGLSEHDSRYAIMRAQEIGTYSFQGAIPQDKTSTIDNTLTKKAEEIIELCEEGHILKSAAVSGDRSNIDLALGLNLVNYNNIKRFKLIVPEIFQMLDKLCKLLIIKRMNRSLFSLDESELTQSIVALDNIATSLNSL